MRIPRRKTRRYSAPEVSFSLRRSLVAVEPDTRGVQAPSLFLPFWRRRFRTRRPPLVRIRTRKPCVRFRFRLFGWKVRFIASVPLPGRAGRIGPPLHRRKLQV
jgi:RecB family exonuclease